MTRTRDKGDPKSNNLQPTKLSSRRDDSSGVKLREFLPSYSPRDMFHPDSLTFAGTTVDALGVNETGDGDKSSKTVKREATKIGLGPVLFNLKPQHYYTSKKPSLVSDACLNYYEKKYPGFNKRVENENPPNTLKERNRGDPLELTLDPICKGMKKLSIYKEKEDEEENGKSKKSSSKLPGNGVNPKTTGQMQQSFKELIGLRLAHEAGQAINVVVDGFGTTKTFKKPGSAVRKAGLRNWKSPEASSSSSSSDSGVLTNLFKWSLPTSTRWAEVEQRVDKWGQITKDGSEAKPLTMEELANQLNISVEELQNFQFHKDLPKVVNTLKSHISHSSLPWLSNLMALSELQQGNMLGATKNATESQGTYLHSEIIDKHICYLSRNNESSNSTSNQRSSFSTKAGLFRKQIKDTLEFGANGIDNDSAFTKAISSFNPDWNIIQITALIQSKNRFGMELYGRRQIPQLLLSAMAHVPNDKSRSCYTTFCQDPPICEGSLMRLGLMEEFQKILDRNLIISDDSIVISRRKYWDERNKHNQAMMYVIEAMEENWIGPWSFLLPGHTTNADLRDKICAKIVTPAAKKYKLTSAQKLVIYKLAENYKYLHHSISSNLETVVAFILNTSENGLSSLCKKIKDIGTEVPQDSRHPTILIVDQDLEIYPWESMACLLNTDVTRMPSLNLIHSNYNFVSSLRPTYPDIVDGSSCTFVLNPDGTLPNVQNRLEKYFSDHKEWFPVIARPPATKEVQECLENQHVFLYNGHGAGSNFYPDYAVQKLVCQAVPLLMGCASAQAHYVMPRVYGSHTIHSYFIAGCPSVVGYLWEVTDAECDRITVDLIERWLPDKSIRPPNIIFFDQNAVRQEEKCLPRAMRISRKAATQFLTQCAIVCYGLPVNTTSNPQTDL